MGSDKLCLCVIFNNRDIFSGGKGGAEGEVC